MLTIAKLSDPILERMYRKTWDEQGKIFPIMHSVLLGQQPGRAWLCSTSGGAGQAALICHAAGFVLCVGDVDAQEFTNAVKDAIRSETSGLPAYLLWYAPPFALAKWVANQGARLRRRLRMFYSDVSMSDGKKDAEVDEVVNLTADLVNQIQTQGLAKPLSFWPTAQALADTEVGVALVAGNMEVIGVCYPAAITDGKAEVDIAIHTSSRGQGRGQRLAVAFMQRCRCMGVTPVWDCFAENFPSVSLAKSLGFSEAYAYDFYSFNLPMLGSHHHSS